MQKLACLAQQYDDCLSEPKVLFVHSVLHLLASEAFMIEEKLFVLMASGLVLFGCPYVSA